MVEIPAFLFGLKTRNFSMHQAAAGAREELIECIRAFPRKLREAKPREGFVEEPAYKILLSNAREPWLRCLVDIGFNFGPRKGEMLAVQVRDVDLLENWLTIRDSKNGDSRRIPLTRETVTLLAECMRGKEKNDFVLTRLDGSHVCQPRKTWYDLCCRAGLGQMLVEKRPDGKTASRFEGLQMHDLRRSAVRRLIRCNVPEKVAMAISGHKTRSVFDRYHITNDRDLEQADRQIELGRQSVSDVETNTKTDTTSFAHS